MSGTSDESITVSLFEEGSVDGDVGGIVGGNFCTCNAQSLHTNDVTKLIDERKTTSVGVNIEIDSHQFLLGITDMIEISHISNFTRDDLVSVVSTERSGSVDHAGASERSGESVTNGVDFHSGLVFTAACESEVGVALLDAWDLLIPLGGSVDVEDCKITKSIDTNDFSLVGIAVATSVDVEDIDEDSVGSGHDVTLEGSSINLVSHERPSVVEKSMVGWGQDILGGSDDHVLSNEETVAVLVDSIQVGSVDKTVVGCQIGICSSGEIELRMDTNHG